jgi:hypothetical protein
VRPATGVYRPRPVRAATATPRATRHRPAPAKPKAAKPKVTTPKPVRTIRPDPAPQANPTKAVAIAVPAAATDHGPGSTFPVLLAALCLAALLFMVAVTPPATLAAMHLGRFLVPRRTDAGFLGFVVLTATAIGFLISRGLG